MKKIILSIIKLLTKVSQTTSYIFIAIIVLSPLNNNVFGQLTTVTQTTAGTYSWTCPAGVTSIQVEAWGGGGAGGGCANLGTASSTTSNAGGGGAGGSYVKHTSISVSSANNPYSYTVGGGGAGVSAGNGNSGGNTTFNSTTIVAFGGGGGTVGQLASSYPTSTGGTCQTPTTGQINYAGGSGYNGKNGGTQVSGGGGGGADFAGAGKNSTSSTGGAATGTGGAGGAGSLNGSAGSVIGGGGGGSNTGGNSNRLGGAGAAGKIILTYYIPPVWTSGYPKADAATTNGFTVRVNTNLTGNSYYVVLPSGATQPSSAQVKAGQDAAGTTATIKASGTIVYGTAGAESSSVVTGLNPNTTYDVYFVAQDGVPTLQLTSTLVSVTTSALSSVADPISISSTVISPNEIDVSFTKNAATNNVLIAWNTTNTFGTPTNGTPYSAGNSLSGGGTIIYNGGITPFNHTGLISNTTYYYKVWSVDGSNNYSTGLFTNATTLAAEPSSQTSAISVTSVSQTGMTINWTNGNGSNRIVLVKAGGAVDSNPVDAISYTANTIFGSGTQIGTGNYVVYNSTGNSVSITGLTAGTNYNIAIFEFNGNAGTYNYLSAGSAISSQYSMYSAPSTPTNLTFSSITSSSLKASFTAPGTAPTGYLVLRRTNNAVGSVPVAGSTYTQGSTLGSDDVVYVGTSRWNAYDQTGLADNTAYVYAVYSYNGAGQATNYSASALINVGITNAITAPATNAATNSTSTGFNANWSAVAGATGYKLDVSTSSTFPFTEDFERCKLGSETAAASGIDYSLGANVDNFMHSSGWSSWFAFQAGGVLYLGYGANASAITTPSMNLTGSYTLTFDCKTYNGGTATTFGVWLSTDNGTTFTQIGTDYTSQATWAPITISITGGNATSKIKIVKAGDTRLILVDNIRIYQTDNFSGYNNLTVSGTSQAVNGLSPNTTYYYRVRAIDANGASLNSGTQVVMPLDADVNASSLPSGATYNITVPGGTTLTLDASKTYNSITIAPKGRLTLNSGQTLTSGTITLQSDETGTSTFIDNNTSNPQTFTANVEQYLTAGRNWYISSPLNTTGSSVLNKGTSIICYDEQTAAWVSPKDNILLPMRGYISQAAANTGTTGTVSFNGTLNTGVQSITLYRHHGVTKEGFNLVGNPYPSYLNWDLALKNNLETTMWYRTKTNATNSVYTFDTYNSTSAVGTNNNLTVAVTKFIPPMQAFWVRVKPAVLQTDTTGILSVDNTMRSHSSVDNKMKSPAQKNSEQKLLRLKISNDANSDETLLILNPNASNEYDDFDSQKMTNANAAIPEIYTTVNSMKLVINGINSIKNDQEIPLGFTSGSATTFSLKATEVNNFETDTQILLKDNVTGTIQDITNGSAYNFKSENSLDTDNRFALIIKSPESLNAVDQIDSDDSNTLIYLNGNNQIVVNSNLDWTGRNSVSVYNVVGQKLFEKNLTKTDMLIETKLLSGIYLFVVDNNGKIRTSKVVLH